MKLVMRRLMRRTSQIAALSALAVAAAGCASVSGALPDSSPSATVAQRNTSSPPASPTVGAPAPSGSSTPTPKSTPKSTSKPKKQKSPFGGLASYVASSHYYVTAAVYDRKTGRTFVFNPRPGVPMRTASIVKVEIMGTLFRKHETSGQAVSASDESLLTTMIENSDNDSATSLWDSDGGPSAIQNFDNSIGMTGTTASTDEFIPGSSDLPGWGWTTTTALDQVTLVKDFAYKNKWIDDSNRLQGLRLMESVEADQRWGVSGGVPAGVTVALKNGWLPTVIASDSDWQMDSIGWVKGDGRNYVLAILVQGIPNYDSSSMAFLDHIGAMVYANLG